MLTCQVVWLKNVFCMQKDKPFLALCQEKLALQEHYLTKIPNKMFSPVFSHNWRYVIVFLKFDKSMILNKLGNWYNLEVSGHGQISVKPKLRKYFAQIPLYFLSFKIYILLCTFPSLSLVDSAWAYGSNS